MRIFLSKIAIALLLFIPLIPAQASVLYSQLDKTGPLSSGDFVLTTQKGGVLSNGTVETVWSGFGTHTGLVYTLYSGSFGSILDCVSNTFSASVTPTLQNLTFTGTQCSLATSTQYTLDLNFAGNIQLSGNSSFLAFAYLTDGGVDPIEFNSGFNSTLNTKFVAPLSFTGSTTVTAKYFLDQNEIKTSISSRNPTQVKFAYSLKPGTSTNSNAESIDNSVAGTGFATTTFTGLADGEYDLLITFTNNSVLFGGQVPFADSYVYSGFTVSGGVVVSTTTPEFYDYSIYDVTERKDCSLTQISNCIFNAGVDLFVPSEESITRFENSQQAFFSKAPFAYASDFPVVLSELFTSSSSKDLSISASTSIGAITFISKSQLEAVPLSSTIRLILGYLIWFMLALTLYSMLLKVHNKET